MTPPRKKPIAVVAAAVAAFALPSSASAGQPLVDLKVAKHKDGPYASTQSANIDLNQARPFYWKVKNLTDEKLPEVVLNDSTLYPAGWVAKWFRGKENITTEVLGDGYEFGLKAGKPKAFRSKLKPTKTAGPACHNAIAAPPETSPDSAAVIVNDAKCIF